MAMPQRDEAIEKIKRLGASLEYAVTHRYRYEATRGVAASLCRRRQSDAITLSESTDNEVLE